MKRGQVPGEVRPPDGCPKCGWASGFTYTLPRYREGAIRYLNNGEQVRLSDPPEYLEWACGRCGYVIETPTVDAQ